MSSRCIVSRLCLNRKLLLLSLPLLAGLATLGTLIYLFREELAPAIALCTDFQTCKTLMQNWVTAAGPLGPALFILLQALQVLVAPIPGELTGLLGGYLFGALPGFLYSTLGITLGSTLAFLVARALGRPFVQRLLPGNLTNKLDFVLEHQAAPIIFLLYVIPAAPKDYLSFMLGLTPLPLPLFLILMGFGRLPATFVLSLQGAQAYQENYSSFFIILGVCTFIALLGFLYRQRLLAWLRSHNQPPRS